MGQAWNNSHVAEKKKISNVLANRYASPEMTAIWSPEDKIMMERKLWISVMKAQAALGVDVPAENVRAAFHYVAANETYEPRTLLSAEQLERMLGGITKKVPQEHDGEEPQGSIEQ